MNIKSFLVGLLLFLRRSFLEMLTYRLALCLGAVSAIVGIIQFAFLAIFLREGNTFPALDSYGGDIMAFLVSGAIFTGFMSSALASFAQLISAEQRTGTFEALLMTPFSIGRVISYSAIASFLELLLGTFGMVAFFGLVFGIPFRFTFLNLLLVLVVSYFPLVGLGLAGAGVLIVTKKGDPVTWVLTTFTTLFSGVLYPVEVLPAWLQSVSWFVPTTRILSAIRSVLIGAGPGLTADVVYLIIASLVCLLVGLIVFRWGMRRALWEGSLTSY